MMKPESFYSSVIINKSECKEHKEHSNLGASHLSIKNNLDPEKSMNTQYVVIQDTSNTVTELNLKPEDISSIESDVTNNTSIELLHHNDVVRPTKPTNVVRPKMRLTKTFNNTIFDNPFKCILCNLSSIC